MLFLEIGFFCCCCVSFHFISKSFVLQANKRKEIYSPVHKCWPKTSWGGNQVNHQNFDPSLLPKKLWLLFMGWSKNKFFWKKKFQNGWLKNSEFFKTINSQYFFAKISGIGPWVSRINWCKGYQCCSIDMVVSLSVVRSNTRPV